MKFHHVAIIVSDRSKSLKFYQDVLGFNLVHEIYREERNSYKMDLVRGETRLELFTFPGAPKRSSYPEALGLRHLAFEVAEIEIFHSAVKNKVEKVEDIRIDAFTGKKFFFFPDPDDLPIEIYEI